jgi:hypothetical protein
MTGTTFTSLIRKFTRTNSSTFSDADIVVFANTIKDELAGEIVSNVDEGYFDVEMVRDLEADIRDYTFTNDILKHIKYAAAKLDGESWSYLRETDFSLAEGENQPLMENSYIKSEYSGKKPEFLVTGRGITILSAGDIIDVTEGLKVVAEVYPEDITTGTLTSGAELSVPLSDITHALPRASHLVWARMVAIEYKQSQEKPIPLTEKEQKIALDLSEMFKKLRKRNTVRTFKASVPNDDGQNY